MKHLDHSMLRLWARLVGSLVLLLVCYFTIPLDFLGPGRPALSWILFYAAVALISALLMRKMWQVLTRTGGHPGVGLVFLIGLSLVVFSATYFTLAKEPGAFDGLSTRLDAFYFTIVTMSTVGYGDITPSGQSARLVVVLQIFYNFVFLATAAGTLSTSVRSQIGDRVRAGRQPSAPAVGDDTDGSASAPRDG